MTLGLEVLVQEVIAAMVTAPWSISTSAPSSTSLVFFDGRPMSAGTSSPYSCGSLLPLPPEPVGESEAGKDSATDSS